MKLYLTQTKFGLPALSLTISAALLLAIWPLPGTIALRHFALIVGFLSACLIIKKSNIVWGSFACWPIWILFSFFLWIIFHLIFLSTNYQEQFQELISLWLRTFFATVIALSLGLLLRSTSCSKENFEKTSVQIISNFLIFGFGGTVIIFFICYLFEVYKTKVFFHYDFYMIPYGGKPPIVIFGAMFFSLILIQFKLSTLKKFTAKSFALLINGVFLVFFSMYFANTKNGMVIIFVPSIIFFVTFIRSYSWNFKKIIYALIICIPVCAAGGYIIKKHVEENKAWPLLFEDIKIGVDIDNFQSWKDVGTYSLPKNSQNVVVNASTYLRSAWAVAALRLIKEHPLGYGLVHHSFGALAREKWPDFYRPIGKFRGASHSGLLDLTLGIGIPGVLLIFIPFGAAFQRATGRPYFWMQFVRWAFPVLIIAYLITEASNNHFIELLFFIIAFSIGLTLPTPDDVITHVDA